MRGVHTLRDAVRLVQARDHDGNEDRRALRRRPPLGEDANRHARDLIAGLPKGHPPHGSGRLPGSLGAPAAHSVGQRSQDLRTAREDPTQGMLSRMAMDAAAAPPSRARPKPLDLGLYVELPLLALAFIVWNTVQKGWTQGWLGDFRIFRGAAHALVHGHSPYVQPTAH